MSTSSLTAAVAYSATISAPALTGAVPEDAATKAHHLKGGKGFTNPLAGTAALEDRHGIIMACTVDYSKEIAMLTNQRRKLTGQLKSPDTTPPTVPVRKPTFLPSRQTPTLRATWLGHACYFVEFPGGLRVLFDPVFTPRCSPFSFLGPKRYTDIPCQIEDIPSIDVVVISHNHYDHLSHPTVTKIKESHPNAQFFVPLGNKKWFVDCGIHNVTELDWWESRDVQLSSTPSKGKDETTPQTTVKEPSGTKARGSTPTSLPDAITATINCLPCQHISARTPFDRGHTLWASWSVTSGDKSVYFGGDTGYRAVPELPAGTDDYGSEHNYPVCPAFAQIGALRGPFDLGLIPIGAYDPRWIMSPMHANPMDAVNIFADTRCGRAMGIHWGTWVLTEEDVLEPPRLLKDALRKKGIAQEGVFDVCDIGESREFSGKGDDTA
ncbi:MAG: hypothetical protein M1819_004777 [Sarea resinae]|nr:MAG: hypothetical protein M1819_004777 [Sarea resinae]